jgi:peptidoglycan/LPS O-acetylase OafA/YrhL
MQTLGDRLSSRENGLDVLRFLLAAVVIVSHTWLISGFSSHPTRGLGEWAVFAFFVLSGYLVTASAARMPIGPYLWRRALRIFPGLWTVLLVTAFVFAPLASILSMQHYDFGDAVSYVTKNALLEVNQSTIDGTLELEPYRATWNGSLWTLMYEGAAYLAVGVLFLSKWVRGHLHLVIPVLFVAASVALPLAEGPLGVTNEVALAALRLARYFLAGMLLYVFRERISLKPWLPIACAAAVIPLATMGWGTYLTPLPLALAVLWAGAVLPLRLPHRVDLSYGMYIWAFPIQQLIMLFGLGWLSPWVTAVIAFTIVVPLAWLSWTFVESPALRLRRLVPTRPRDDKAARSRGPAPLTSPVAATGRRTAALAAQSGQSRM